MERIALTTAGDCRTVTRRSPNVWKAAHPRYPDRKALIACTEVLTFRYEFPITALDFVTAARARIRSRIDWLAQMAADLSIAVVVLTGSIAREMQRPCRLLLRSRPEC